MIAKRIVCILCICLAAAGQNAVFILQKGEVLKGHESYFTEVFYDALENSRDLTILPEEDSRQITHHFSRRNAGPVEDTVFRFIQAEFFEEGYLITARIDDLSFEVLRGGFLRLGIRNRAVLQVQYHIYDAGTGQRAFSTSLQTSVSEFSRILLPWRDEQYRAKLTAQERTQMAEAVITENINEAENTVLPFIEEF
jgi:hypothetical protein